MKVAAFLTSLAIAGAALAQATDTPSGLVVLDHSAQGALDMRGTARVEVPARAVYVNSSHRNAVSTTGTAVLDAPFLYIVGGASFGGQSHCTGTVIRSVAPYADPYAGTNWPSTQGMTSYAAVSISNNSTVTLNPGFYSGGISITGNANVTFSPGVYVIGGAGLDIRAGTIVGEGVCFVIQSGAMDVAANASITLSPPAAGAPMAGMVIAQPHTNTSAMDLAGGSGFRISGSIYLPGALLNMVGNSSVEGAGPQMGDVVVAKRVSLRGTAIIKIGRETAPALQLPQMAVYD